jgi:hypothetical protein
VKENENENDDDEDEADDEDGEEGKRKSFRARRASDHSKPKPLLGASKLTIISPAMLSASPTAGPEKKKFPRPLMKAATISSGLNSSPSKGIRETLKGFHSPTSSPVTDRKMLSSPEVDQGIKQPNKSLLRGSTESALPTKAEPAPPVPMESAVTLPNDQTNSRERCDSENEIPGPPSYPPPDDSPVYSRNRIDSG